MQAPYIDRWERTKRYLLRNFLVNPGFRLSPVPEEERSSPDSDSLPDLILEPAPDRHDHPPDYYEGLERRMKLYYRQLFLDANESDDDSNDFEVNRSMASTFRLDIDGRKDNEANIIDTANDTGDLDDSIAKNNKERESSYETDEMRQVTKSTNESFDDENEIEECDDEFIDTRAATYSDTRHVSADSKRSSVDDEENLKLIQTSSISESIHSYNIDDPIVIVEDFGNNQSYDKDNQSGAAGIKKSGDLNEINASNEAKSDSEDAALCHRISTTVAEIHEIRPERRSTQEFDNGSPVLIPRLLQFSRRVFGSRISGESFNVSIASDEFIRRLSSHRSDASNKHDDIGETETQVQRLLAASEVTRASLDSDKLDTEYIDTEDKNQEDDNIEDRTRIEDIIQPHEITRASLASDKTVDAENKDYVDTEENKQDDDRNYDIADKSQVSEIQTDDEGNKSDKDVDNEPDITGIENASINWNNSIGDDEDCFENAVRRGVFVRKARKMMFVSSSDESFDDLEPIAQSSEKSIDDEVEVMREAGEAGGSERWSWHGQSVRQDSPTLAFEVETNADKLENEPSDSTEINATFEEDIEEDIEEPYNTNPHDIGKIIDEFWSVSPADVDIESPTVLRCNKRRTDSETDVPSKRKKDVAIQTGSVENCRQWEDVRSEFFVGTPLVYRLCGCQHHVCS